MKRSSERFIDRHELWIHKKAYRREDMVIVRVPFLFYLVYRVHKSVEPRIRHESLSKCVRVCRRGCRLG